MTQVSVPGSLQGCGGHPRTDCTLQEASQALADGKLLPETRFDFLEVWQPHVPCVRLAQTASPVQGTEEESVAR